MSNHLVLFSQLPVFSKFRFETADAGKVLTKIGDDLAETTEDGLGTFQTVNPGVLVFPIPNPIEVVEFTLQDGFKWFAVRTTSGWWLDRRDLWYPGQLFRSLEDVINHLGA